MIPRGAAPLIAMRLDSHRPAGPIWVTYGDFREPDWWKWTETCHRPEILVRPEDPIERLDLRCLHGLDVILFFAEWSAATGRLYERVQEYAEEIAVLSPAFDDDIGWHWIKGRGQIGYNERHWLTQYRHAQQNAMAAAVKGNDAAYADAQAKEKQALEAAPWLR